MDRSPTFEALADYRPEMALLRDRVILVTGAADGIGRSIATACAAVGANTILLDCNGIGLEMTEEAIAAVGGPAPVLCPMDLAGSTLAEFQTVAKRIEEAFGRIDGLVNNAGWIGSLSPFEHSDPAMWSRALNVNLAAPFFLTQQCMPLLHRSADPVVVFSLDDARRAYWGGYGVAKAGLEGFLYMLSDEYHAGSAHPLRVFGIDTGPVMTPGRRRHYPGEQPGLHPEPEAVVGPYLYALGPDSAGCTGVVLRRRHANVSEERAPAG